MKRKILALLLATTMVCGLFAGCGGSETTNNNTDNEQNPTNTVIDGVVENESQDKESVLKKAQEVELKEYLQVLGLASEDVISGNTDKEKYLIRVFLDNDANVSAFDENHNEIWWTDSSGYKELHEYEYEENGLIKKEIRKDIQGEIVYETVYERDERGNVLKEIISSDTYAGQKNEYEYDENNNCIKENIHYDDLSIESRYEYDENNLLIKSTETRESSGEKDNSIIYYEYDENNNCIKETEYLIDRDKEILRTETTHKYDEYGKEIELVKTYYKEGGWDITEDSESLVYTYMYEYDEKGRPIKYILICDDTSISAGADQVVFFIYH